MSGASSSSTSPPSAPSTKPTIGYHTLDGLSGIRVSVYVEKVTRKYVTCVYETTYTVRKFSHAEWEGKNPLRLDKWCI